MRYLLNIKLFILGAMITICYLNVFGVLQTPYIALWMSENRFEPITTLLAYLIVTRVYLTVPISKHLTKPIFISTIGVYLMLVIFFPKININLLIIEAMISAAFIVRSEHKKLRVSNLIKQNTFGLFVISSYALVIFSFVNLFYYNITKDVLFKINLDLPVFACQMFLIATLIQFYTNINIQIKKRMYIAPGLTFTLVIIDVIRTVKYDGFYVASLVMLLSLLVIGLQWSKEKPSVVTEG